MPKYRPFTAVLTKTLCALLTMAAITLGPSAAFGQTPPPATFVNPIMYDGGSIIPNYIMTECRTSSRWTATLTPTDGASCWAEAMARLSR